MTLNRTQGQTLKQACMFLDRSVFSHGHLYVGFSRYGDLDCVFIFADQKEFEGMQHLLPKDMTVTRNIVYKEIFQRSCIV